MQRPAHVIQFTLAVSVLYLQPPTSPPRHSSLHHDAPQGSNTVTLLKTPSQPPNHWLSGPAVHRVLHLKRPIVGAARTRAGDPTQPLADSLLFSWTGALARTTVVPSRPGIDWLLPRSRRTPPHPPTPALAPLAPFPPQPSTTQRAKDSICLNS